MARKTRKIKRSRSRRTRQVKRSRRTRQVKRSRRTRQVKRSRRTRQVKRSRRVRRVKRSRRKIKGGAFPVIGLGALALLGAGSVAAKKLMNKSKAPGPLTNDDMQRYSDMSSYGTGLQERYEPSSTDVAVANSRRRWAEEDAKNERAAVEEKRRAVEETRRAVEKRRSAGETRRSTGETRRSTGETRRSTGETRRAVVADESVEEKRRTVEEKRRAMVAEEAIEKAAEKARIEANYMRRREIYDTAERKRKQDHHDKEQIRIQALISRDLARKRTREAASKVERVPVRPTVFKKVKDMNTQEMHDAAYFIKEDKRIKDEIAARPENAMSWNPFSY